jgi:hypothetical protein
MRCYFSIFAFPATIPSYKSLRRIRLNVKWCSINILDVARFPKSFIQFAFPSPPPRLFLVYFVVREGWIVTATKSHRMAQGNPLWNLLPLSTIMFTLQTYSHLFQFPWLWTFLNPSGCILIRCIFRFTLFVLHINFCAEVFLLPFGFVKDQLWIGSDQPCIKYLSNCVV